MILCVSAKQSAWNWIENLLCTGNFTPGVRLARKLQKHHSLDVSWIAHSKCWHETWQKRPGQWTFTGDPEADQQAEEAPNSYMSADPTPCAAERHCCIIRLLCCGTAKEGDPSHSCTCPAALSGTCTCGHSLRPTTATKLTSGSVHPCVYLEKSHRVLHWGSIKFRTNFFI